MKRDNPNPLKERLKKRTKEKKLLIVYSTLSVRPKVNKSLFLRVPVDKRFYTESISKPVFQTNERREIKKELKKIKKK